MPSTCVFEFDRPDPIYYTGEIINGRVQLNTTKEKSVREVYIAFDGNAKVRWEEEHSRERNGKTEHYTEYYSATRNYVNTKTTVFGGGTLPAGAHAYTFSFSVPERCPTSCVEQYGKISYEISLKLDRPLHFDNVFTQPITVLRQFDLNWHPELLIPIEYEDIKYFCCWPCASGPVTSTLTIPFGGYAPGQKIKYQLEINNESGKYDLDGIMIKFKEEYRFTAHTPSHKTRHASNTLASAGQNTTILRLSKRIIEGELLIPPVPPSSEVNDDDIISVSYEIKMIINTGSCHTDSEISIPIKIGTVPLAQSASDPRHAIGIIQPLPTAPDAPDTPGTPGDKPPNYNIFKPPSFEEATSGNKFIDIAVDEHNRTDDFIPKYPMYSNFAMPPTAPPPTYNDIETLGVLAPPPTAPVSLESALLIQTANSTTYCPAYPIGETMMPMLPIKNNDGFGWKS